VNNKRKILKTFVLISSKNSASGESRCRRICRSKYRKYGENQWIGPGADIGLHN
jgi:hypothetical protein